MDGNWERIGYHRLKPMIDLCVIRHWKKPMAPNMVSVNLLVLHQDSKGHSFSIPLFSILISWIHHNFLTTPTTAIILSHSPTAIKFRPASVFLRTGFCLSLIQYFILEAPSLVLLALDTLVNCAPRSNFPVFTLLWITDCKFVLLTPEAQFQQIITLSSDYRLLAVKVAAWEKYTIYSARVLRWCGSTK